MLINVFLKRGKLGHIIRADPNDRERLLHAQCERCGRRPRKRQLWRGVATPWQEWYAEALPKCESRKYKPVHWRHRKI